MKKSNQTKIIQTKLTEVILTIKKEEDRFWMKVFKKRTYKRKAEKDLYI